MVYYTGTKIDDKRVHTTQQIVRICLAAVEKISVEASHIAPGLGCSAA